MYVMTDEGKQAVQQIENLSADEKAAAVKQVLHANPGMLPTSDKHKAILWVTLLGGLFLIALVAIGCGVLLAMNNEDSTALLAIASAVVAGAIGLFSNPPTGK